MPEFFFTFGQKYRYEEHPAGGHPDGWFTIEAEDENAARAKMVQICGQQWGTSYTAEDFHKSVFPRGELKRFKV